VIARGPITPRAVNVLLRGEPAVEAAILIGVGADGARATAVARRAAGGRCGGRLRGKEPAVVDELCRAGAGGRGGDEDAVEGAARGEGAAAEGCRHGGRWEAGDVLEGGEREDWVLMAPIEGVGGREAEVEKIRAVGA